MIKEQQIPKGYKPSSLGIIPNDWEVIEFGKLFEFKNGINAEKESYGSGVKFINVMEIIYNDYITSENITGSVQISEVQKELYLVKSGDVLFNRTSETINEIGLTAVYLEKEPVVFGGFVIRGRPITNLIHDDFKKYCFRTKTIRDQIIKSGQGAVRSNIGQSDLEKIQIALPKLPEQKSISAFLKQWDQSISKTQQLIYQKELRKKWLMQQLLTGKKRLKGFKGKWEKVMIKNVFNEIREINDGNGVHSIMTISSKRGLISQEDKFDRVIAGDSLKKYIQIKKGDFAYNKGNSKTYPMGCVFQLEEKKSALVPFVYICFHPTNKVNSLFYKQWFGGHGLDNQLQKIITSGARGDGLLNVNQEDFFKLKIPFPQKEEQTAIANVLQEADKEIDFLKHKKEQLKKQRSGLMQILLTGKKRLKVK